MKKFDEYFLMNNEDIIEYTLLKLPEIAWDIKSMKSKEIGDGNLNYVFKVWDDKGHSVIIKHAGEALRISEEMKVSTDRNRIESEILLIQEKYAKLMVPHIYFYDTVMCACGMEDLSDHRLMRYALMEQETFPRFSEDITEFMVKTLLVTSDLSMEHKEKKELVKRFISPELCEITENLVLTEPYNNMNKQNSFSDLNKDFVKKELYEDKRLHLEVAKLKFKFMTETQALIHGDLHTGSIFVKEDSTKVFDPEFAIYGPMGYDIGNIIANLIFAYGRGLYGGSKEFCKWILVTIEEIIDKFIDKFNKYYDDIVTEPMAKVDGFKEYYLAEVIKDSVAYAGTELHRRTVGMAKVKDLTDIDDEIVRAYVERINILCGKHFILYAKDFKEGRDVSAAVIKASDIARLNWD